MILPIVSGHVGAGGADLGETANFDGGTVADQFRRTSAFSGLSDSQKALAVFFLRSSNAANNCVYFTINNFSAARLLIANSEFGADGRVNIRATEASGTVITDITASTTGLADTNRHRLVVSLNTADATEANRVRAWVDDSAQAFSVSCTTGAMGFSSHERCILFGASISSASRMFTGDAIAVWISLDADLSDIAGADDAARLAVFGSVASPADLGATGAVAKTGGGTVTPHIYQGANKARYSGAPATLAAAWNGGQNLGSLADWSAAPTLNVGAAW